MTDIDYLDFPTCARNDAHGEAVMEVRAHRDTTSSRPILLCAVCAAAIDPSVAEAGITITVSAIREVT